MIKENTYSLNQHGKEKGKMQENDGYLPLFIVLTRAGTRVILLLIRSCLADTK